MNPKLNEMYNYVKQPFTQYICQLTADCQRALRRVC